MIAPDALQYLLNALTVWVAALAVRALVQAYGWAVETKVTKKQNKL